MDAAPSQRNGGAAFSLERLPRTLEFVGEAQTPKLRYIDQTELPGTLEIIETASYEKIIDDIQRLAIRGAPALGVAGAAAYVLYVAYECAEDDEASFRDKMENAAERIANARPTAVNLSLGVTRVHTLMKGLLKQHLPRGVVLSLLFKEVKAIEAEDVATNRVIGEVGASVLGDARRILTHCNAGSLATVFFGTAVGVIYTMAAEDRIDMVYVDETRPLNQGSRLTAWELGKAGVPATLICDDMAASIMAKGLVDAVIVGADRIARNGDAANKIGTYGVAVLAKHHGIPFYVAAPRTSIDLSCETGNDIVIEQRSAAEVSTQIPEGVVVCNPAFDVTPASLITAIICENGSVEPARVSDIFEACDRSPES